jgi:hypothetical protein
MAERLAMAEGQAHYRRRKVIPEPVFGWIKEILGFRRLRVRGPTAVAGEWHLVCLAQNLKRLQRLHALARTNAEQLLEAWNAYFAS